LDEVAAVCREIPVTCKTTQALHGREIDELVAQDLVRRHGRIDHLPLGIMTNDRRSAQALEDPPLDLLRAHCDQTIESSGEALDRFSGQTNDEIRVDMH